MKRVLIIGNSGAGKTTFAKNLAEKLSLPLIHLDKIYWQGDWEHLTRKEFDTVLQGELEKPSWIIDGNFDRTISHRLKYCDTVFFFDVPTVVCLWGITKRIIKNYGRAREDMGGNCVEYFDKQKFTLYKNAIYFNKNNRKNYYKILSNAENVNVIIFKSRRSVNEFLNGIGEKDEF